MRAIAISFIAFGFAAYSGAVASNAPSDSPAASATQTSPTTDSVLPAPGFAVTVQPALIGTVGDSTTLSYVVTVAGTAHDSLTSFVVDAPGVTRVVSPGTWPASWVGTQWHVRSVAAWGKDSAFILPGASTPPLQFTARGAVGIVQFWAEVHERLETADTLFAADSIARPSSADTTVNIRGVTGYTVGVAAMPSDLSSSALTGRLSGLVDQACALGWIDNHGTCNSLSVKVKAQSGPLGALLNELSAQRGKHVSEAAYILLSTNTQFLLGKL
jgi:hypothetical protein